VKYIPILQLIMRPIRGILIGLRIFKTSCQFNFLACKLNFKFTCNLRGSNSNIYYCNFVIINLFNRCKSNSSLFIVIKGYYHSFLISILVDML